MFVRTAQPAVRYFPAKNKEHTHRGKLKSCSQVSGLNKKRIVVFTGRQKKRRNGKHFHFLTFLSNSRIREALKYLSLPPDITYSTLYSYRYYSRILQNGKVVKIRRPQALHVSVDAFWIDNACHSCCYCPI